MKTTTDLRTITKRFIAIQRQGESGSYKVARVTKSLGDGTLDIHILTGDFPAKLATEGQLTLHHDGGTQKLGSYKVIWQGTLPRLLQFPSESVSEMAQDFVFDEINEGRDGLIDYEDLPASLSRRALRILLAHTERQETDAPALAAAINEARKAVA